LIFGHLLTSSNYDDSEQRFTGGRHGFGAKLTNILSTEFTVEIADAKSGKQFKQVFQNNMKDTAAPVIAALPTGSGSWTKITFRPDLPKFGLKILDAHTLALMRRRVFDVAACCCDANITVTLNGDAIPIKRFDDYIQMHDLGFPVSQALDAAAAENNQPPASRFVTSTNSQWTIAVRAIPADSDSEAVQVSFVNSIATLRGGTHVAYISDQIARYVSHYISKKHKDLQLSVPQIKSRLVLFISGQVQNPSFDSQTKETLTLPADHFADSIPLSDRFFHEIVDHSGIVESSIALGRAKQLTELSRALGGKTSKKRKLLGIPKLDDANSAGGPDSANCTLILTEGMH
jgi:DNA topoisomerase-2